jgi:hypothetical protein
VFLVTCETIAPFEDFVTCVEQRVYLDFERACSEGKRRKKGLVAGKILIHFQPRSYSSARSTLGGGVELENHGPLLRKSMRLLLI